MKNKFIVGILTDGDLRRELNHIRDKEKLEKLMNKDMSLAKNDIKPPEHHDIPGDWFKGPF